MSTILKTLKKLEQDKNDLRKNLDLKEMVLQGDGPAYLQSSGVDKKIWLFGGLTVCGVLMGVTIAFLFLKETDTSEKFIKTSVPSEVPKAQPATPASKPSSQLGFSLSAIPESPELKTSKAPLPQSTPTKKIVIPALPATPPAIQAKPKLKLSTPVEPAVPAPVQKSHISKPAAPRSTETVERGTINGVKIKGIIFFKAESKSNHIFVSTPTEKNRKLKLGDSVLGAVLENVKPNKAVFSREGRLFAMGLGE